MPSTVAVRSVTQGTPANGRTTCTADVPATEVGDVVIAIDVNNTTNKPVTSVSGLGGTWQLVTSSPAGDISGVFSVWTCLHATPSASSRTLTGTGSSMTAGSEGRALIVFVLTGAAANSAFISAAESNASVGSGDQNSPSTFLYTGEIAIAVGYSDTEPNAIKSTTPGTGWTIGAAGNFFSARYFKYAYRVSTADAVSHYITNARASGGARSMLAVVLGALDIAGSLAATVEADLDMDAAYLPPPVLGELDLQVGPRVLVGSPPAMDLSEAYLKAGVYRA